MSGSSAAFERFFATCGIPQTMVSKYASRFVKERIHPALMRDLGKEDLRELGVSALGDQLAIMRYIKQCDGNPPEFNPSDSKRKSESRQKETAEFASDEEDEPMFVDSNPSNIFKAPDREDIYHVKMPAGTLPKTRKMLEKNRFLRDQGVLKRGVSGIRKSGVELSKPVLNTISTRSKVIGRKPTKIQDTDITSSTAFASLGSMRSDSISTKTTVVADLSRNSQRLANRFASLSGGANIRIQLRGDAASQPSQRRLINYGNSDIVDDSTAAGFYEGRPKTIGIRRGNFPPQMVRVRKSDLQPEVRRAPIAERIQIVGQSRRSRPVITVRGEERTAAMDTVGRRGWPTPMKRTSILDRISVAK
uniref:SAM domain-containing protein n=1 Tax=Globodera rostochiensis TaxID=31243 RepID=A0A914HIN4_GLORO